MGYVRTIRWDEREFTWEGVTFRNLEDFLDTVKLSPEAFPEVLPGSVPLSIVKKILGLPASNLLKALNADSDSSKHLPTLLEEKFIQHEKTASAGGWEPFFVADDVFFGQCSLRGTPQEYAVDVDNLYFWAYENSELLPENRTAEYEALQKESSALQKQVEELKKNGGERRPLEPWGIFKLIEHRKNEGADDKALAKTLKRKGLSRATIDYVLHPAGGESIFEYIRRRHLAGASCVCVANEIWELLGGSDRAVAQLMYPGEDLRGAIDNYASRLFKGLSCKKLW